MSGKQIKRFKRSVSYSIKAIKEFKNTKRIGWLRNNISALPIVVSKKRHSGESFADFKARRKKCNERRRGREV